VSITDIPYYPGMHVLSTGRNPFRTVTSGSDLIFPGFSASSSSVMKPDYFVQVVRGEKVVQKTGGRLSVPQRVRLRHLKQLGHTFTRSQAVGGQYYNFTRSETVGAQPTYSISTRSEAKKFHS
jgi:hypothetical protein